MSSGWGLRSPIGTLCVEVVGMSRVALCLGMVFCLMGAGGVCAGEVSPADRIKSGAELAREERFDEAIAVWLGVLGEVTGEQEAKVLGFLGLSFKQTGRFPEAWHYLTRYRATPQGATDEMARGWLDEVVAGLGQRYVKVVFQVTPVDGMLRIPRFDGTEGETVVLAVQGLAEWWFLPGERRVRLSAEDGEGQVIPVLVPEGAGGTVAMAIAMRGEEMPVLTAGKRKEAEEDGGGRTLEWSLLGSGLVLAVAGGIFHGVAYLDNEDLKAKYSDETNYPCGAVAKRLYDQEYDDLVQANAIIAYVLYGVGGGVVLAGLLLLDATSNGGAGEEYLVAPMVLPGGGGASVSFGW